MIVAILMMLVLITPASAGYLGLHHTDEEVVIWRARRTQTSPRNYAAMWDAVVSRANAAVGSRFVGNTGGSCFPSTWAADDDGGINRTKDIGLVSAGLVWAVNGTTSYRDKVLNALLAQAGQSGTNFASRSQWCANVSAPYHNLFHWLARITNAYSYIRGSISSGNRTTLDAWFLGAGDWLRDAFNEQVRQRFTTYASENYTCNGVYCPGSSQGITHFGGPEVFAFGRAWDNIFVSAATGGCAIGVLLENASIKADCTRYVKEWVKFATYSGGQVYDQHRWDDGTPAASRAYFYPGTNLGSIIEIADHFARAGDSTLYEYTTSVGQHGTSGGTKGILNAILHISRQTNNTIQEYASNTSTTNPSLKIDHLTNVNRIDFVNLISSNLYYNNTEVNTAIHTAFPSPISCGGYDCTLGAWGQYGADLRFLFMDTAANPYTGAPAALTPSLKDCWVSQSQPNKALCTFNDPNVGTFTGTTGFTAELNAVSNTITTTAVGTLYLGDKGVTLTLTDPVTSADDVVTITYTPGDVMDGSEDLEAAVDFSVTNYFGILFDPEQIVSVSCEEPGRPLSGMLIGDGVTEEESWVCATAANATAVFDLGTSRIIDSVFSKGDTAGNIRCQKFDLKKDDTCTDTWTAVLTDIPCNSDVGVTTLLGPDTARCWQLIAYGDSAAGVQLRKFTGTFGSGTAPPPVPPTVLDAPLYLNIDVRLNSSVRIN